MTPTRLRQIAQLIEHQCIELHIYKRMPDRIACDGCKAAAVELCEFAREIDRNEEAYERLQKQFNETMALTPSGGRAN